MKNEVIVIIWEGGYIMLSPCRSFVLPYGTILRLFFCACLRTCSHICCGAAFACEGSIFICAHLLCILYALQVCAEFMRQLDAYDCRITTRAHVKNAPFFTWTAWSGHCYANMRLSSLSWHIAMSAGVSNLGTRLYVHCT